MRILLVLMASGCVTAHASPPKEVLVPPPGEPAPDDLVDAKAHIPSLQLDIRYATKNNFAKRKVYKEARCVLRYEVAQRLARVQSALQKQGLGLKVWDCHRPFSVQEAFWKLVPDARYVAKPVRKNGVPVSGSKHNRGAAVDLTLVDSAGRELPMPTDYDDFSKKAHHNYRGATKAQKVNRRRLREAMEKEGFSAFATEWWHYDGPGWQRYPLTDERAVTGNNK